MRAMSTESVSSESTASRGARSSLRAGSRDGGGPAAGASSSPDARVSRSDSQPPLLLLRPGLPGAGGVSGFGLAPHRLGGIERAAVTGDDAIELGQSFDLIDDDAAHLRGALGGLLRQFEDAAAQLGARH